MDKIRALSSKLPSKPKDSLTILNGLYLARQSVTQTGRQTGAQPGNVAANRQLLKIQDRTTNQSEGK